MPFQPRRSRFSALSAELVGLKVNVIVTGGSGAINAAKKATSVIPIVMTNVADPVELRFVGSLAWPGGNITGLTTISPDLSGKRVELLKEVSPEVSFISVLWNPENPGSATQFREPKVAA